jgi:predicted DNA-binding transcriptional regulator YafY
MANPTTRLLSLILLLESQPGQKAAHLAEQLQVSVRTLHRYMGMLDELGIPIYAERGPQGGFSLVRGYKMPPLIFTPAEAGAIYLGASLIGEIWGSLFQEDAFSALAKLDNVLPDEQRREAAWARSTLLVSGLQRPGFEKLAAFLRDLRIALHNTHQVQVDYQTSGRTSPETRRVDPYALVYRWGYWYLIAYCHLRQAMRIFRLDRIKKIEITAQSFTPPDHFDAKAYIETDFKQSQVFTASVRFLPAFGFIAHSNPSTWDDLHENQDGSVTVQFSAPDLQWAVSTVLSYGPVLEVLDPPILSEKVHEWALGIAKLNPRSDNE